MAAFRSLLPKAFPNTLRLRGVFLNQIRVRSGLLPALNTTIQTYSCRDIRRYSSDKQIKNVTHNVSRILPHKIPGHTEIDAIDEPILKYVKHDDDKALEITWRNNETQKYVYPWLRDSCRCESCYSQATHSRSVCFLDLDVEAIPLEVKLSVDGTRLIITWPDEHVSEYSSSWLRENRFDKSMKDPVFHPRIRYWGNDIGATLNIFELKEILNSDEDLYEMLLELKTSGICCVKGGGNKDGQVKKIADRIAFLHLTYFGAATSVKLFPDSTHTHVSYTNKTFPMHTDLSYKGRPPGAQMLHCIQQVQGEGGENWFADGFKVALDFKKADPEAYDLLCNVPMEFKDMGTYPYGRMNQRACHPVIGLEKSGHPDHIYLSDHGREPMLRIPADEVLPVYRALKKFSTMYHDPKNVYVYKLKEGDIMVFDNRRVIHGRASFHVTKESSRHLETGYLEWDEINSRIRILMEELSPRNK